MKYGEFGDGEKETSLVNEAGLQIQRLHNHWLEASRYAKNGELEKWRWVLNNVWLELSSDALKQENTGYDERKENYYFKKVFELKELIRKSSQGNQKVEMYDYLSELHMLLRYLQDQSGKGGKYTYAEETL